MHVIVETFEWFGCCTVQEIRATRVTRVPLERLESEVRQVRLAPADHPDRQVRAVASTLRTDTDKWLKI